MPFVAAPNIAMMEFRCTRNGQQVENRIMVNCLTTPILSILQEIAIEGWNWWETNHAEHLSDGVLLREVVCTSLHVQNGPQYTYAPDTTTTGDLTGVALPNEVAFCVSLRSGVRGRSARGRWYTLSVMQSQMLDDNFLTAAAANDFVLDIQALLQAIIDLGYLPVIVSYITNKAPRAGGPVYFQLTGATAVDTGVDSMRRRKPGVGQ